MDKSGVTKSKLAKSFSIILDMKKCKNINTYLSTKRQKLKLLSSIFLIRGGENSFFGVMNATCLKKIIILQRWGVWKFKYWCYLLYILTCSLVFRSVP